MWYLKEKEKKKQTESSQIQRTDRRFARDKGGGVGVQSLSHVWRFVTPWAAVHQAPLSYTISRNLLKFISISNHPILCHPCFLLPSILPSTRVFSNESALPFKQPKYWGVSASAMNIQSWFSFRIDWFDLAVQGTSQVRVFSNTTIRKQFFSAQPFLGLPRWR